MAEIPIRTIASNNEELLHLVQEVEAVYDEIRRRAFLRFTSRGVAHGFDRIDWLAAENELIFSPLARLTENNREFRLQLAIPGLKANQIRVSLLPDSIIVDSATPVDRGIDKGEQVCFSEFSDRRLLRKTDLPQELDLSDAIAWLEDGLLEIVAQKAVGAISNSVELSQAAKA